MTGDRGLSPEFRISSVFKAALRVLAKDWLIYVVAAFMAYGVVYGLLRSNAAREYLDSMNHLTRGEFWDIVRMFYPSLSGFLFLFFLQIVIPRLAVARRCNPNVSRTELLTTRFSVAVTMIDFLKAFAFTILVCVVCALVGAIFGSLFAILFSLAPLEPHIMWMSGVLLVFFVGLIAYVTARWALGVVAIVVDDMGVLRAIKRSWSLTRGHWVRVLSISVIVSVLLPVAGAVAMWEAAPSHWLPDATMLVSLGTSMFAAVSMTMCYHELCPGN